ncbi:hypothetical protein M0R72_16015 [Candidatus Pacearchaeota archaeon]|jgi:cell division protein FtsB|nr:hypothetical protein [Candidatus Pacearchaeota archaeon]
MKKIKNQSKEKQQILVKRIITIIILLILFGLILAAAFGNLDAVRTLWKTP